MSTPELDPPGCSCDTLSGIVLVSVDLLLMTVKQLAEKVANQICGYSRSYGNKKFQKTCHN